MLGDLPIWRRSAGAALLAVAACLFGGAPTGAARAADAVVSDVRVGDHGKKTRVVFDLTGGVAFNTFVLADPYRVVVDLPEVGWRLPARPLPTAVGLLRQLRYGLYKPGQSRIVIDLSGPATVDGAFLMAPSGSRGYRLVVDLVPAARATVLAATQLAPPEAASETAAADAVDDVAAEPLALAVPAAVGGGPAAPGALAKAATPIAFPFVLPPPKPQSRQNAWVVALDPGHGGMDPGGIGASGTYEKHITLAIAREVAEELEKTGRYKPVLVRDRDIFVRLRDRIAIARDAGADLFVSFHADVIADKGIRGLSVYTLSEQASDREAAQLAEMSNKVDLIAGVDLSHETPEVTNILIDLAQRETMNESSRFAGEVVKQLARETQLLNNTHRFAGFAVLKAPDVPSILVELGFLSNARDEAALKTAAYRSKLSAAVVRAIDEYFLGTEQARLR